MVMSERRFRVRLELTTYFFTILWRWEPHYCHIYQEAVELLLVQLSMKAMSKKGHIDFVLSILELVQELHFSCKFAPLKDIHVFRDWVPLAYSLKRFFDDEI